MRWTPMLAAQKKRKQKFSSTRGSEYCDPCLYLARLEAMARAGRKWILLANVQAIALMWQG
jgi:hypothetical protein